MTAQYTVVQYLPDPVIGERINIGVVVVGEGRVLARFLDNWQRVTAFSNANTTFLREFADKIDRAVVTSRNPQIPLTGMSRGRTLDIGVLTEMVGTWDNTIQFTALRGSINSPEELLDEISARFLRIPERRPRRYRGRDDASHLVIQEMRSAVRSIVGPKSTVAVRPHREVVGEVGFHTLDVVVENGRPFFAAHGLSFEGTDDSAGSERSAASYARDAEYAVLDIRDRNADLTIGVMIFPPRQSTLAYERTLETLVKVGANVVSEQNFPDWSLAMAERLLDSAYIPRIELSDG